MTRQKLPQKHRAALGALALPESAANDALLVCFERGEFLCQQGEALDYLFFLLWGQASVSLTTREGRTLLLSFYRAGEVLGEVELLDDGIGRSGVQAVSSLGCIALSRAACLGEAQKNPAFLRFLAVTLAKKLDSCSKNSAVNILTPLEGRLCAYIVRTQENGLFREHLSQTSELMGASYRHLLRTLKALCERGVLDRVPGGYEIADSAALTALAKDFYML